MLLIIISWNEASAPGNRSNLFTPPVDASPQQPLGTKPGSLGAILQNFKSITTRKINQMRSSPGALVWQSNYYEHIIRNAQEWERIHAYILANPHRWSEDRLYRQSSHSR